MDLVTGQFLMTCLSGFEGRTHRISRRQRRGKIHIYEYRDRKAYAGRGKSGMGENVRVGYLDQHSTLTKGMTIESVLKSALRMAVLNWKKT